MNILFPHCNLIGLDRWKKKIIHPLKSDLTRLLLRAIQCDRMGQSLYSEKTSTIHGVVESFVTVDQFKEKISMKTYKTIFEAPFLETTVDYYR